MPKLTKEQWQECREQREAGETFANLAMQYDINKSAIVRRAQRENWGDGRDLEGMIRQRAAQKVMGAGTRPLDLHNHAALIDAEAERRAEIERRHRAEWAELEPYRLAAMKWMKIAHDLGENKEARTAWVIAKIASEVAKNHVAALAAKQYGECKAHRLFDAPASGVQQIILEIPERGYEPAQ